MLSNSLEDTKKWEKFFLLKSAVCNRKKSRLIKEQEASELLRRIKIFLTKIPLLGSLLF